MDDIVRQLLRNGYEGSFKLGSGYPRQRRNCWQKKGIEANFCVNDVMALGAMNAIQEEGLKIPEDIAVVGFDDIELAALSKPLILWRSLNMSLWIAAELLFQQIEGHNLPGNIIPSKTSGKAVNFESYTDKHKQEWNRRQNKIISRWIEVYDKSFGRLARKAIGGTLGAPIGKKEILGYLLQISAREVYNDDLDLQLVWLHVMQSKVWFNVNDLAQAWLNRIKYPFDEYGVAINKKKASDHLPLAITIFPRWDGRCIRWKWAPVIQGSLWRRWNMHRDAVVDHALDGVGSFLAVVKHGFCGSSRCADWIWPCCYSENSG